MGDQPKILQQLKTAFPVNLPIHAASVDPLPFPSKFEGANNPNHEDNVTETAFVSLSDRYRIALALQNKSNRIK